MILHTQLEPRFVKGVPRELEQGVLYVSMEYGTVVHSCCCGCGHEVVTPLTPTDWTLTFNGEQVSLWPSIGNWNLPCKSHYVIKSNRVLEAGPWGHHRIEAEKKRDKATKETFYHRVAESDQADGNRPTQPSLATVPPSTEKIGLWSKLWNCIRKI
ncbi:DUF6527 family protein [Zoogloea oleivorans]|uniref:DUF6527 family protein n=1 Tax=Zoogloea oleivorans TaxID=1552750 RepID=UPI001CA343AD|nr:DUF6527 family protein [Zoogloea oleivorans]